MYDIEKIKQCASELGLEIVDTQGVSGCYDEDGTLIMSFDDILENFNKLGQK